MGPSQTVQFTPSLVSVLSDCSKAARVWEQHTTKNDKNYFREQARRAISQRCPGRLNPCLIAMEPLVVRGPCGGITFMSFISRTLTYATFHTGWSMGSGLVRCVKDSQTVGLLPRFTQRSSSILTWTYKRAYPSAFHHPCTKQGFIALWLFRYHALNKSFIESIPIS